MLYAAPCAWIKSIIDKDIDKEPCGAQLFINNLYLMNFKGSIEQYPSVNISGNISGNILVLILLTTAIHN